jgi:hypothetical protein
LCAIHSVSADLVSETTPPAGSITEVALYARDSAGHNLDTLTRHEAPFGLSLGFLV